MKTISLYIAIFLVLVTSSICQMDLEFYNELKENAPFEVLDYDEMVDIFKDYNPGDPEISRRNQMEDERRMKERIKELSESEYFLALDTDKIELPIDFDWRKKRPECFSMPENQMNCGSCYAFAVVSAFEERICIKSKGKKKANLSQQDVLSCDRNGFKCEGGMLYSTWEFLENYGTCSYHCKPYTSFDGFVPVCYNQCNNRAHSYFKWKTKKDSIIVIEDDVQKIKEEIFKNGPVTTQMQTFTDMFSYKSGIYMHTKGKPSDAHAITIVGWGQNPILKVDYWIIRNSWGPEWGENGYFKVMIGYYGVADYIIASEPDI